MVWRSKRKLNAKVSWKDVWMAVKEGGLGIMDIEVWNKCFDQEAYMWYICQKHDSLWIKYTYHFTLRQ